MSRKYYATAATLSSFLRFHHHFLLRSNAQLPAVASFIFILLVILSSSSLISATLSTRKITTPPRNSNNMKQHQYTNLVASSNVVKHRQGGLMDSSPSPSLYLNSETPKASTVHLEQQQNDPAIAQGAPQTTSVGSPYVVIASGSILLSIAVAIMIVGK